MGRLFDAVAALAGVRGRVSYEGQAAIELEWLSTAERDDGTYPFELTGEQDVPLVIDVRPLIRAVSDDVRRGTTAGTIGRRFHATVIEIVAAVCHQVAARTGVRTVVLSGGVFMNALLSEGVVSRLAEEGFRTYRHERVPPNDGGLCLGQLAIAAATMA
jgi:hydrogenase maturation protein HypF